MFFFFSENVNIDGALSLGRDDKSFARGIMHLYACVSERREVECDVGPSANAYGFGLLCLEVCLKLWRLLEEY